MLYAVARSALKRGRGVAVSALSRQRLEQADVVRVELADPELREDDDADRAAAVDEWHGDHGFVDLRGAGHLDGVLALERVRDEDRGSGRRHGARDPFADLDPQHARTLLAELTELATA